jgi:hypothetical protein
MSTRKTPGGESGRCVRVTALTSWNPKSHIRLAAENIYLYWKKKIRGIL